MVESDLGASIQIDGLSVRTELDYQIAALRYFSPSGQFAARVRYFLGAPVAEPLRAGHGDAVTSGAPFILAWRSPTETWLLTENRAFFTELSHALSAETDGCLIDQTGGIRVIRVAGPKAHDLLLRLGSAASIPAVGEAHPGRLAELTVLTASIRAGEYLLLVERVYANHLLAWVGATAADL
jgi:sarcosine oxidase gamma subunit